MALYFHDLWDFLCAIILNWGNVATGGVLVGLLWLYTVVRQTTIPRKAGLTLAVIFLFFAVFRAWRDQHSARVAAEEKFAAITVPRLSGTIDSIIAAPAGESGTILTVAATITNTGAPSIVNGFKFELNLASGHAVTGRMIPPPMADKTVTLSFASGRQPLQYSGADFLPGRALAQPVVSGGATSGFCQLIFPNVGRVEAEGSALSMTFADVTGKSYSAKLTLQRTPDDAVPDPSNLQPVK